MSHPLIPPDCRYFTGEFFDPPPTSQWDEGSGHPAIMTTAPIALNPEDGLVLDMWRPVIAAVARCAWLDEAEKYPDKFMKYGDHPHNENKRQEALFRADEWKKWGEEAERESGS